jgi:hypothetical protein
MHPGDYDPLTSAAPMSGVPGGAVASSPNAVPPTASRQYPVDPLTGDYHQAMRNGAPSIPVEAPLSAPVPEAAESAGRLYFVEKVKPEELMANLGTSAPSGTPTAHGPFPIGTPPPLAEIISATPAASVTPVTPVTPITPITPITPLSGNTPVTPITPVAAQPTPFGSQPPVEPATGTDFHTVYSAPEGDDTVYSTDIRLKLLPCFFEVVSGGADGLDTPGKRIPLWSLDDNMVFGIARPTNNQDRIANFIPLLSRRVSRSIESQGNVIYDPAASVTSIRNYADPAQRKNPIRVQDHAMMVGETRPLHDGDRIQIGDVIIRFHATGGDRMGF